MGTIEVESLSSYIARLADAHGGDLYTFTQHEIAPWIYPQRDVREPNRTYQCVERDMLDFDVDARIAMRLAEATSQPTVMQLPLSRLCTKVSSTALRANERRWCAHCLAASRHQRALWLIKSVRACPIHKIALAFTCPRCGSEQNRKRYGNFDVCQKRSCQAPLMGEMKAATEDEIRDAASVASFMSLPNSYWLDPTARTIPQLLMEACNKVGVTKQSELMKRFGLAKASAFLVANAEGKVQLDRALKYAASFGVNLGDFVSGKIADFLPKALANSKRNSPLSAEMLRARIKGIHSMNDPRLSLSELCRQFGISPRTALRIDPSLVKVSKRHAKWRKECRRTREDQAISAICSKLHNAAKEGRMLRNATLGAWLKNPNVRRAVRKYQDSIKHLFV